MPSYHHNKALLLPFKGQIGVFNLSISFPNGFIARRERFPDDQTSSINILPSFFQSYRGRLPSYIVGTCQEHCIAQRHATIGESFVWASKGNLSSPSKNAYSRWGGSSLSSTSGGSSTEDSTVLSSQSLSSFLTPDEVGYSSRARNESASFK
ncbi:hypothetical protein Tco_1498929 [Tanacetum coccineum]